MAFLARSRWTPRSLLVSAPVHSAAQVSRSSTARSSRATNRPGWAGFSVSGLAGGGWVPG